MKKLLILLLSITIAAQAQKTPTVAADTKPTFTQWLAACKTLPRNIDLACANQPALSEPRWPGAIRPCAAEPAKSDVCAGAPRAKEQDLDRRRRTGRRPDKKGIQFELLQNNAVTASELQATANTFMNAQIQELNNNKLWLNKIPPTLFDLTDITTCKPFVQKLIIPAGSVIAFHGDMHGDIHSLNAYIHFLQKHGYMAGWQITDPSFYMVFLGDYVDRGHYGAEVLYAILRLKLANPNRVYLVRGNHEDIGICTAFGFTHELITKFGESFNKEQLMKLYDFLPAAIYLGITTQDENASKVLQCCHGGMELGFDANPLLHASGNCLYQSIELLDRAGECCKLTSLDAEIQKRLATLPFDPFAPQNYSDIGFMWSDFIVNFPSTLRYNPARGFAFGSTMTHAIMQKDTVYAVLRAHQHSANPLDAMMQSILANGRHNGISVLWDDVAPTTQTPDGNGIQFELLQNNVVTFLVAPDSCYSGGGKTFDYDAFGILHTDNGVLTMHMYHNTFDTIFNQ